MVLIAAMLVSLFPAILTTTTHAADSGAFGISTPSAMTEEEKQAAANKKITGTEYSDLVDLDALSKASTEETPDIFDINTMLGDGLIGQF